MAEQYQAEDAARFNELLNVSLPDSRRALLDSHQNLQELASYCEHHYDTAPSVKEKDAALEESKQYAVQSLASVAYMINTSATHVLELFNHHYAQLSQLESTIHHITQNIDIHKEKVARREIGTMAAAKRNSRVHRVTIPHDLERGKGYRHIALDYNSLDNLGHGVGRSHGNPPTATSKGAPAAPAPAAPSSAQEERPSSLRGSARSLNASGSQRSVHQQFSPAGTGPAGETPQFVASPVAPKLAQQLSAPAAPSGPASPQPSGPPPQQAIPPPSPLQQSFTPAQQSFAPLTQSFAPSPAMASAAAQMSAGKPPASPTPPTTAHHQQPSGDAADGSRIPRTGSSTGGSRLPPPASQPPVHAPPPMAPSAPVQPQLQAPVAPAPVASQPPVTAKAGVGMAAAAAAAAGAGGGGGRDRPPMQQDFAPPIANTQPPLASPGAESLPPPPEDDVGDLPRRKHNLSTSSTLDRSRRRSQADLPPPGPPPDEPPPRPPSPVGYEPEENPPWAPVTYIQKVKSIYAYEKNRGDELSFDEDTVIFVTRMNADGWYEGVVAPGVTGVFPGNYVDTGPEMTPM